MSIYGGKGREGEGRGKASSGTRRWGQPSRPRRAWRCVKETFFMVFLFFFLLLVKGGGMNKEEFDGKKVVLFLVV